MPENGKKDQGVGGPTSRDKLSVGQRAEEEGRGKPNKLYLQIIVK